MKATDQNPSRQNALAKGASTYESHQAADGNPRRVSSCGNRSRNLEAIQERHPVDRQTYKIRRSAALAEWQSIAA